MDYGQSSKAVPVGSAHSKYRDIRLNSGRRTVAIPGPSMMPEAVLAAFAEPMPDIYAGEIVEVSDSVRERMSMLAQTQSQGFILTGNGHSAWQMATSNTLAKHDTVLVLESGLFPRVWGKYTSVTENLDVQYLAERDRAAVDLEVLRERLTADKGMKIRAVLMAQVDTASSVRNDVAGVRRILDETGHDALLMVDCVASLATERFEMDNWGVDIALASCQKGLMVPPGLAFVWASDKALQAYERADQRVGYFDWQMRLDTSSMYNYYAGTPPIAHLRAMKVALDLIEAEGAMAAVWQRHEVLAGAVRECVSVWSEGGDVEFNIIDEAHRSNCVTTVLTGSIDPVELRRRCDDNAGLVLGMGLEGTPGFRIAHMGYLNPPTLLGVLGTTEAALLSMGAELPNSGVAAAASFLAPFLSDS